MKQISDHMLRTSELARRSSSPIQVAVKTKSKELTNKLIKNYGYMLTFVVSPDLYFGQMESINKTDNTCGLPDVAKGHMNLTSTT